MPTHDQPNSDHEEPTANYASSWRALEHQLATARTQSKKQIPHGSSPIDSTLPIEQARSKWLHAAIRCREPVADLVREWIRTGQVPYDDFEQYRVMLDARFDAAHRFVHQFVVVQRASPEAPPRDVCIFPFPDMPPSEVLSFLLLDWWLCIGTQEYFDNAMKGTTAPTPPE